MGSECDVNAIGKGVCRVEGGNLLLTTLLHRHLLTPPTASGSCIAPHSQSFTSAAAVPDWNPG